MSRALDRGQQPIAPSALASGTANNTTFLRGDSTWQTPPAGFSGAETITASTTLTSTSKQVQVVNVSAGNQVITLPNATTLQAGKPVFVFNNISQHIVTIKQSSGATLGFIYPNFEYTLTLRANNTADGVWESDIPRTKTITYTVTPDPTFTQTSYGTTCAQALTPEISIVLFRSNTRNIYAVAINTETGEQGSPTLVYTALNTNSPRQFVARISNTQAVLVVAQNTSTSAVTWTARTLNVSGTTITANTAATSSINYFPALYGSFACLTNNLNTYERPEQSFVKIGNTLVFSGYVFNATGHMQLLALEVSGNDVSIGSPVSTRTSLVSQEEYIMSSTGVDSGLVAYRTSTVLYARAFTVSGTSISLGAEVNTSVNDVFLSSAAVLNGKIAAFRSNNNTVFAITGSGTTATINSASFSLPAGTSSLTIVFSTYATSNEFLVPYSVTRGNMRSGLLVTVTIPSATPVASVLEIPVASNFDFGLSAMSINQTENTFTFYESAVPRYYQVNYASNTVVTRQRAFNEPILAAQSNGYKTGIFTLVNGHVVKEFDIKTFKSREVNSLHTPTDRIIGGFYSEFSSSNAKSFRVEAASDYAVLNIIIGEHV